MILWNFFLGLILCGVITAYVDERHEKFQEPTAKTLRSRFGLVEGGEIRIDYRLSDDEVNLLVLIVNDHQYFGWYDVPLRDNDASTICGLPSIYREMISGNGTIRYPIPSTDKYCLVLASCNQLTSPVSFHATVEMMNPAVDHDGWNYLPIERVILLRLFIGDFVAFFCLFIVLLGQLYFTKWEYIKWIHYGFLINIIICCLGSLLSYGVVAELNDQGYNSVGTVFMDNFIAAFRSGFFYFTVLVLGLGWTITKETISIQEYQVVAGFFFFYIALGISQAICVAISEDTSDCQAIPLFLYILRGIIMISSIIAMNYTVSHLRTLITNLTWCPSIPYLYVRLRNYYNFRTCYLLYILLPTVVLMIQVTMLTWKEDWVPDLLNKLITLTFYCIVGMIFSPLDVTMLTRPFDGTLISVD